VGRPVKVEFERLEEFVAAPRAEPWRDPAADGLPNVFRAACSRGEAHVTVDNGAYVSWGSTTPYVMLARSAGLYRVPNVPSTPPSPTRTIPYSGSMRGTATSSRPSPSSRSYGRAGRPTLGLDRWNPPAQRDEVRRRNPQVSWSPCRDGECLEAVAEAIGPPVPPLSGRLAPRRRLRRMFHVAGGARIYRRTAAAPS